MTPPLPLPLRGGERLPPCVGWDSVSTVLPLGRCWGRDVRRIGVRRRSPPLKGRGRGGVTNLIASTCFYGYFVASAGGAVVLVSSLLVCVSGLLIAVSGLLTTVSRWGDTIRCRVEVLPTPESSLVSPICPFHHVQAIVYACAHALYCYISFLTHTPHTSHTQPGCGKCGKCGVFYSFPYYIRA